MLAPIVFLSSGLAPATYIRKPLEKQLTDFGLSGLAKDTEHRMGGTLAYMPPEAMRKNARLGFGLYLYSLGFLS